jgi:endoglucanase Acf2
VGEFGNNNESSSESINAWVGLILWGEVTGNKALRDLGIYLYTNEIEAINHYWFDIHGLVFAPEYKNAEVSLVFGGMYRHDTWWIDDPRQIKGINLLPVTTAHTYLGTRPGLREAQPGHPAGRDRAVEPHRQEAQPTAAQGHLAGHLCQVPGAG